MSRHWLTVVVAAVLAAPAPAQNLNYDYFRIADTSGRFDLFGNVFSINGFGKVTFLAEIDSSPDNGIYIGTVGSSTLNTVGETPSATFACFCDGPTINSAGHVAFGAVLNAGGQGVYVGTAAGGTPKLVADTSTAVPMPMASATFDQFGTPAINGSGQVAFTALLDPPGSAPLEMGVFVGTPNPLPGPEYTVATVAVTGDDPTDFGAFSDPAITSSGTAAFFAALNNGKQGVYVGAAGGTPVAVAVTGTATGEFDTFGDRFAFSAGPAVNDAGQVAFTADLIGGGSGIYIRSSVGGPSIDVATSGIAPGDYDTFGDPSINGSGQVAFKATLNDGTEGIFTGDDPASMTDYVIRTGDPLDGSTVDAIDTSRFALADDGRIVFWAELANGVTGLFVATPVPEPGLLLGVATVGLAAARRVRRR